VRDFAEVFDYFQVAIYDRAVLAEPVTVLLRDAQSRHVLDCACGTGLPAIDLRAMGFDIDCGDADASMLDQFRATPWPAALTTRPVSSAGPSLRLWTWSTTT
jgi:predicted TPR repeat methyltransferase